MKTTFCFTLLLVSVLVRGQEGSHMNYDWDFRPTLYVPGDDELNEDVITVFEKHVHEYDLQGAKFNRYELLHVKKHLLTDKAIEKENQFYVWTKGSTDIHKLKARVIQPSGKIIELDEKSILESKDANGKVNYRYFAFEGLEKGSTIEYLHYIFFKESMDIDGNYDNHDYVTVNGDSKKKSFEFTVIHDNKFQLSWYCNSWLYKLAEIPSTGSKQSAFQLKVSDVPKAPSERYSIESSSRHRLFYHIDLPAGSSSFDAIALDLHEYFSQTHYFRGWAYDEMIEQLINRSVTKADTTNLLKLRAIERTIKSFKHTDERLTSWTAIEKNKIIDDRSAIAFMISAARYLGIETRLMLTCDRTEYLFPPKYESYVFLDDVMLCFPAENAFFLPDPGTRIGPAPFEYIGNNALTIWTEADLITTPHYEITTIPVPDIDYSKGVINADITIDTSTIASTIHLKRSVSGYLAQKYQATISSLNGDQLEEMKENFLTYVVSESAQLGEYSFENDRSADFNDKPLIGRVNAASTTLTAQAGNKLLVNVGTLIGTQGAMYDEKPEARQLQVDIPFPQLFLRTIRVAIPPGYRVANAPDFNRTVTPDPEYNSIGFLCTGEQKGNVFVIKIDEWYAQLSYPKEQYHYLVDVTNASADFNALVLVLEKQQ